MNNQVSDNKKKVDITFFVPCLNEEKNIGPTLGTIMAAVRRTGVSYEIYVVDDGSKDGTAGVVEAFMREHPEANITLKKNPFNMGLGRNYVDSAYLTNGEYYMLVNGDHAETEDTLVNILQGLHKADMVIPYFEDDSRRMRRRALSKTFTAIVNFISGYCIRYYNGPVAHRRFNVMRWHSDTDGFAYQAEIITRLLDEGATYIHVAVENIDRKKGESKAFSLKNILSIGHSLMQISLRRLRWFLFYKQKRHRGSGSR